MDIRKAINWALVQGLRLDRNADGTVKQGELGLGPAYPESPGDREKGKFRSSEYERLTVVAVCNDNGTSLSDELVKELGPKLEQLINETRLLRHALVLQGVAADLEPETEVAA